MSRHSNYQTYRINFQAARECKCRFVYAALAVPVGANDICNIKKNKIQSGS